MKKLLLLCVLQTISDPLEGGKGLAIWHISLRVFNVLTSFFLFSGADPGFRERGFG